MKKLTLLFLLISVCSFGQQYEFINGGLVSTAIGTTVIVDGGIRFGDGDGITWAIPYSDTYKLSQVTAGMKREVLVQNGVQYLKYTPTTMPIKGAILYLHGMGERGSDITLVERNEIPKQLKNGLEVPYIVVCPQLPSTMGGWWGNITNPIIDMMKTYNLDLHITGLSLGAMSVPTIVGERPGTFKTAATVCGKVEDSYKAKIYAEFSNIPSVHYYDPSDGTIAYGYSSIYTMVNTLKPLGKDIDLVLFKGYPNAHNVWSEAYLPANYWAWLDSKVTPPVIIKEAIKEQYIENGKLVTIGVNGTKIIN